MTGVDGVLTESRTFAFLFTDIEGSTRMWESEPEAMRSALARHDEVLQDAITGNGGQVFSTGGDGFAAAFATAGAATSAAAAAQRRLLEVDWETQLPLRVRMGVHVGHAQVRDGNYFGSALNRCARLMAAASGGQIVLSQAAADLLADDLDGSVKLMDLGEHRFRDLARPERVYQLCAPGIPERFGMLRSLDAFPTNLPPQLSEFIGRDNELVGVEEAIAEARLVTLTGVGGVGKTRLALQAAADAIARYPGGVWLVELAGLVDPGGIVEAVIAALKIAPQPGMTLMEALAAALSERRTLVVLDNCEHLIEGAADFADNALRGAPELALLATSREPLGISGERVLSVRPLSVPQDDHQADGAFGSEAVQLFCERARAVRSSFSLGPDNTAAVSRICRRLDGIPLAVELAAARVRSMSPAEIAMRLDSRFQLLTGGSRGAASRHQTLRRAIDWSFELLTPEESELVTKLSVCAGGFDLSAAEAIGSSESVDPVAVVDLLDHLVEKSLVVPDDLGAETRYHMLETIREYAFEKLEDANLVSLTRRRHADHYCALAEQVGEGMRGPDELSSLERAEQDLDNFRAAVLWSCDSGDSAIAQRILGELGMHGTRIEASVSTWAGGVVDAVRTSMESGASCDPRWPATLSLAAWRSLREGNMAATLTLGEEAMRASATDTALGKWGRCMVHATVTAADVYTGKHDVESCEEWVRLAREIGDRYLECLGLTMLCVHRMFSGRSDAVEAGELALEVGAKCGSPTARAYATLTLGQAVGPTDPHRSVLLLDEAISLAESVENEWAAAVCSASRAAVFSSWGDRHAAARALLESGERSLSGGNLASVAAAIWGVAAYLALQGRPEGAAKLLGFVHAARSTSVILGFDDNWRQAVHRLPETLGLDRYQALEGVGAVLDDAEVMALARAEVQEVVRAADTGE